VTEDLHGQMKFQKIIQLTEGEWWDLSKPNKLQISLDAKVAKDFNIKLGDIFTLNIYGREIEGKIVNFRVLIIEI
jgi:putative ABC transport system permease protein